MSTPTSVYRYLDADGVLIYVGITNRGIQRQAEHVVHSKWWRFVRSQDVEHYDDRETAERRERHLIEKHQPPFNVVHNTDHPRRLAAYLKHAEPERARCGHCEGCQLDAAGENGGDPYGCVWDYPEDEREICPACHSLTCLYAVGLEDGARAGRREGFTEGQSFGFYDAAQAVRAYLSGLASGPSCAASEAADLVLRNGARLVELMQPYANDGDPAAVEIVALLATALIRLDVTAVSHGESPF